MSREPEFRKSSFCGSSACVEVKVTPDAVTVRATGVPRTLTFTPAEWNAFLDGVRAGEFDA